MGFLAPSPGDRERLALVNVATVYEAVVARRKTTREIERYYFERFRRAHVLPAGPVTYGDKPDVTLTGDRTIGIEITRFYLQSGRVPYSEQQQRPLRNAVVSEARDFYSRNGGKNIELTIAFEPRRPITPQRRKSLPEELAALAKVIDNSPTSGEVERRQFRAMPEVSLVYLNTREYADAKWQFIGSFRVGLMSQADLESIVRDKETRAAQYYKRDEYWLLIVVDPMDPAQEQEIRIEGLSSASTVFQKIIVYKPGFEHIVEVKLGKP
jgi:hypothetical protein